MNDELEVDDKLVNEWMMSLGFKWYTSDQEGKIRTFFDGYWNIDHPNGTHESVTQLVARRFYANMAAHTDKAVKEARIDELGQIEQAQQDEDKWSLFCMDGTSDFSNYINHRIKELQEGKE